MDAGPVIRMVRRDEARALAELHVQTFGETHGSWGAPTLDLREQQWRELLAHPKDNEFCLVIEAPDGQLIGFARCLPYTEEAHGEYKGLLNKIYLLKAYHRTGLGQKLLRRVAHEFLARGVDSMLLFGDARSATNGFYEKMGGTRLLAPNGEFHGGYAWSDLRLLASV